MQDALDQIEEAKDMVAEGMDPEGMDPEEVLQDMFGLEPDYVYDLI